MDLPRRALLKKSIGMAAAGAAMIAAPSCIADSDLIGDLYARISSRRLAFDNLHTGEKLDVAYWENGVYVPDALQAVNHVLRDHRNNEVHPIEPRLLDLLTSLSGRLNAQPRFEVISGYRSPASNALMHAHSGEVATNSLHMYGMAIDIRMPSTQLYGLRNAAESLSVGGVGYYPDSDFVHVDVGRVRRWSGT